MKFIKNIINYFIKLLGREVFMYLLFGALATVVNIATYALCTKLFHIEYLISNIIAWITAVIFAYITNKIFVFESKTSNKKGLVREFISFCLARIATLVIEMLILYVCVDVLKLNDLIIKIIANIVVIILNYIFSKLFIFKKKENKEKTE